MQQVSVPEEILTALGVAIQKHGLPAVARQLGVTRQTLASMLAGLPVRRGSILVVESGLKTWSAT
jgi:DNA-binding phage protein